MGSRWRRRGPRPSQAALLPSRPGPRPVARATGATRPSWSPARGRGWNRQSGPAAGLRGTIRSVMSTLAELVEGMGSPVLTVLTAPRGLDIEVRAIAIYAPADPTP